MLWHNTQLPRYYSWMPDPWSEATNALHQHWAGMNLWANPPWILISRILAKTIREKATMTLLAPFWPSAPWFPLLMSLLISPPILLLSTKIVLQGQNTQETPFRNPKWRIFACRISGHGTKTKAFRRNLSNYSYQNWIQILQKQYHLISGHGYIIPALKSYQLIVGSKVAQVFILGWQNVFLVHTIIKLSRISCEMLLFI